MHRVEENCCLRQLVGVLTTRVENLESELTATKLTLEQFTETRADVKISTDCKSTKATNTDEESSIENHISDDQQGFQHSNAERKRIAKGLFQGHQRTDNAHHHTHIPTQTSQKQAGSVVTPSQTSTVAHNVKAAKSCGTTAQTKLVYVGRLSADISERCIREQLKETGVDNCDIADVIQLKCRAVDQSSFCISLNTKQAENMLYKSGSWPNGVKVRSYKPSVRKQVHKNVSRSDKNPNYSRTTNNNNSRVLNKQHRPTTWYQDRGSSYNRYEYLDHAQSEMENT